MRAAVVETIGSAPEVREVPDPQPADGLELGTVTAAALNPIDQHFASGRYPGAPAPHVIGREGVARLADGRRVYFYARPLPEGSVATKALVSPANSWDVPDAVGDAEVLTAGVAGITAWLSLARFAEVSAGDDVLVVGASGAVGQMAVQIAKLLGAARVVGAARDTATVEALGAVDATVSLTDDDLPKTLKEVSGDGFDVVIDTLGGPYLSAALVATALGARALNLGNAAGIEVEVNLKALQGRRLIGFGGLSITEEQRGEAFAAVLEHLQAGELGLPFEVFPLERIGEAWELQAAGPHRKVVVGVGS